MDIFDSARNGDEAAVARFLSNCGNPNASDRGLSLLHLACRSASEGCVRLLLEAGADVHAFDDQGMSPIFSATGVAKSVEIVKMLVDRGSSLGEVCEDGTTTPLFAVFNSRMANEQEVVFLDRLVDALGVEALHLDTFAGEEDEESVTLFLKACEMGRCDVALRLIELGCDTRAVCGVRGRNALHLAIGQPEYISDEKRMVSPDFVRALVAAGVDVDGVDEVGVTPLQIACDMGNAGAVQTLLECWADFEMETPHGRAIDVAFAAGVVGCIVPLMREYGLTPFDDFEGLGIESRLSDSREIEKLQVLRREFAESVGSEIVDEAFDGVKASSEPKARGFGL